MSAAKTDPDMVEEKASGKVHSVARKMCKRLIVTPKKSWGEKVVKADTLRGRGIILTCLQEGFATAG